jgi:hypothetical protein
VEVRADDIHVAKVSTKGSLVHQGLGIFSSQILCSLNPGHPFSVPPSALSHGQAHGITSHPLEKGPLFFPNNLQKSLPAALFLASALASILCSSLQSSAAVASCKSECHLPPVHTWSLPETCWTALCHHTPSEGRLLGALSVEGLEQPFTGGIQPSGL